MDVDFIFLTYKGSIKVVVVVVVVLVTVNVVSLPQMLLFCFGIFSGLSCKEYI